MEGTRLNTVLEIGAVTEKIKKKIPPKKQVTLIQNKFKQNALKSQETKQP